ncbi:hypothetical protein J8C02_09475 [Chloracidobacterium sp. MS 40/45]|uniref:hypothetical protein n=1 Tax=Chloracidobacterium aggregatum TaxID=2851959 RepID=UPI001B8D5221|nr:hypothetical protein [Chloracidobacterium aggregatum]QUV99643.1 hypothetical protein J8C02_09475 [Chloracidobacterium sp. MS 40/45]
MVSCSTIRRQLEAVEYDPEALPPEAAAHLMACAECRAYAAQMQSLRGLLSGQPRVLPPATFDAELRLRLGRDVHRFREPFLAWVPTPVLAAVALAVVVTSALAVRSSMQMVLHPAPTVAAALVLPTLPERALVTALSRQLGGNLPGSRPAPARAAVAVARPGRMTPVAVRQAALPAREANGVVVLWRGRSGERVLRLPPVVYGAQPIVDRRPATEGESSDDSIF